MLILKIHENYIIKKVAKAVEMTVKDRHNTIFLKAGQTQNSDSTALDYHLCLSIERQKYID